MSRSPEEREQARREREIKRLKKAGEPIPPELIGPIDAPAPGPPEPLVPAQPPPAGAEPPAPPAAVPPPPDPDPVTDEHAHEEILDEEHPSGEWHFETGEHDAVPAAAPLVPGAVSPSSSAAAAPPRRRRRKAPFIIGGVVLLFVVVVGWAAAQLFQPFGADGSGTCTARIPDGASTSDIADALAKSGVVSSSFFFQIRAQIDGADLHSGRFVLGCDMEYSKVITALSKPPVAPKLLTVSIPEGLSRREIAPIAKKDGLEGDYVAASKRSPDLTPTKWGAPKGTSSLEGFLFPATYQFRRGTSVDKLVGLQLETFKKRIATVDLSYAKKKNLTVYDVLIIASMIDREAGIDKDRPKIAAVIYNRLKAKIPLGIDATTRYEYNDWQHPITESQLQSSSPYNTRIHQGLPPTPIGNPGLASIKAAANPSRKGYLYFVVTPCGNGAQTFSTNNAQFLKDQAAYNAARAANGGNDPSTCKKKKQ